MTEKTLFPLPPADGNLTGRQSIVLDYLKNNPAGATATEIGVNLHLEADQRCPCSHDRACKWAMADALNVLRALRKRGLVTQPKGRPWQLKDARTARPAGYDPSTAPIPY